MYFKIVIKNAGNTTIQPLCHQITAFRRVDNAEFHVCVAKYNDLNGRIRCASLNKDPQTAHFSWKNEVDVLKPNTVANYNGPYTIDQGDHGAHQTWLVEQGADEMFLHVTTEQRAAYTVRVGGKTTFTTIAIVDAVNKLELAKGSSHPQISTNMLIII